MTELTQAERQAILSVAVRAARDAGVLLMNKLGALGAGEVSSKSERRDLVTSADLASERLLVKRLREHYPEHSIEAEEETRDAPRAGGLRWFLDPLDGTINFVHSLPAFAVSMGLYRDNVPELAVVYAPRLDETFWAVRGGGAFLNGEPIHVSRATELGESVLATGFPYRRSELQHDNLANFERFFHDVRGLRRMGSAALDLSYTAAGRFDGFWELHLSPHDVAAGALLVREAGGVVTDADGGDDWLRGGHIVAGPSVVQALIRQRLEH